MGDMTTSELPDDPLLREAAVVLEETGHAGFVFDADWNVVHASDELLWVPGYEWWWALRGVRSV